MFSLLRHLVLMVSEEKFFFIICFLNCQMVAILWEWLMLLSLYFNDVFVINNNNMYFKSKLLTCCGWSLPHVVGEPPCYDRYYCHFLPFWGYVLSEKQLLLCMADLIAIVDDVIATYWLSLYWLMLLPMWWLMLLPMYNGWCFYHMWQMEWPLLCDGLMLLPCGRWYSHLVGMWADVICLSGRWNNHWVNYFNLSSLLLLRTSSHMWGRWYYIEQPTSAPIKNRKKAELTYVEEALTTCKYPTWAIQRVKLKKKTQKQNRNNNRTNKNNMTNRSSITVPDNQGLSESFKNIGKKYGIQVHFKSGRTLKDELVAPKDKDHITKKSRIIYRFKCDSLECDEEYIGETSRTFGERFKEHLKAPSPIHDHSNISGHTTTLENFSIVGREEQTLSRLIKESMYIRVNGPSLNKNIGKYHLPHMWDEVLNNSRELKLK